MSSKRNKTGHASDIFQQIALACKLPTYIHKINLYNKRRLNTIFIALN